MEKCINHPDIAAEGNCAICGNPVCHQCIAETREDKVYCYDCSVKRLTVNYRIKEEKQKGRIKKQEEKIEKRKRWTWLKKAAIIAGIVVLIEITIISTAYYLNSKNKNASVRITDEMVIRAGIDRCAITMHTIYKQLKAYAKNHQGHYPERLSELISSDFRKVPLCPLCKKPYLYQPSSDGRDFILSCPDPVSHGLREFYFTGDGGPFLEGEEGEQ
jgi:hypothetical protein